MISISIESQIKPRLAAVGGSIALIAMLARCSKTLLGEAANGTSSLNRETALRVDAALKRLESFVSSVAPIRPDLRDARLVEQWLEDFEAKRLKALASTAAVDPWQLLRETAADDIDTICSRHGWQRSELASQLAVAQDKLHEIAESLAASNADRRKLLTTV